MKREQMKIEAGKYYRMRCGGAVKIGYIGTFLVESDEFDSCWYKQGGESVDARAFDLVAEITEAEYNRIVSGEAQESAVLDTAESKMMVMRTEIEALKAENARLKEQRRFEAAKAAMQGMLTNPLLVDMIRGNNGMPDAPSLADFSAKYADALLKALEEQK